VQYTHVQVLLWNKEFIYIPYDDQLAWFYIQ